MEWLKHLKGLMFPKQRCGRVQVARTNAHISSEYGENYTSVVVALKHHYCHILKEGV
jgi:hypothetical protein